MREGCQHDCDERSTVVRRAAQTRRRAVVVFIGLLAPLAAPGEEIVRNWFNDPFFQVRSAIANCPVPLGPYGTEADRMRETHYR